MIYENRLKLYCIVNKTKQFVEILDIKMTYENMLKLYCGYKYTMPCLINRIWSLYGGERSYSI